MVLIWESEGVFDTVFIEWKVSGIVLGIRLRVGLWNCWGLVWIELCLQIHAEVLTPSTYDYNLIWK
jgi:hypothetical protein